MPHVWPLGGVGFPAAPGSILQTYKANPAAADFPFNSAALTNSNWPANPNFTKISNTSLLFFSLNCDVDPGATPDTIELLLLVDNIDISNVAMPIVNANIMTWSWPRVFVTGIGFPTGIPAGLHTFNLGVETFNNRNCNLRSSTSCDLQVIEYESPH